MKILKKIFYNLKIILFKMKFYFLLFLKKLKKCKNYKNTKFYKILKILNFENMSKRNMIKNTFIIVIANLYFIICFDHCWIPIIVLQDITWYLLGKKDKRFFYLLLLLLFGDLHLILLLDILGLRFFWRLLLNLKRLLSIKLVILLLIKLLPLLLWLL